MILNVHIKTIILPRQGNLTKNYHFPKAAHEQELAALKASQEQERAVQEAKIAEMTRKFEELQKMVDPLKGGYVKIGGITFGEYKQNKIEKLKAGLDSLSKKQKKNAEKEIKKIEDDLKVRNLAHVFRN